MNLTEWVMAAGPPRVTRVPVIREGEKPKKITPKRVRSVPVGGPRKRSKISKPRQNIIDLAKTKTTFTDAQIAWELQMNQTNVWRHFREILADQEYHGISLDWDEATRTYTVL